MSGPGSGCQGQGQPKMRTLRFRRAHRCVTRVMSKQLLVAKLLTRERKDLREHSDSSSVTFARRSQTRAHRSDSGSVSDIGPRHHSACPHPVILSLIIGHLSMCRHASPVLPARGSSESDHNDQRDLCLRPDPARSSFSPLLPPERDGSQPARPPSLRLFQVEGVQPQALGSGTAARRSWRRIWGTRQDRTGAGGQRMGGERVD
jgi:hypothetical protein